MAVFSPAAALMLLFITCRNIQRCSALTVDPPEDLKILDHGHLGHLEMRWSAPSSLANMTECLVLYQLEYFNSYTNSWTVVRTPGLSYSAQFDLMEDVRVRVYTVLKDCNAMDTVLKSSQFTEVVQKPPLKGSQYTAVKDFKCVFYNMETMDCRWRRSKKFPVNSKQYLYFWHKKMERAEECPKYTSDGQWSGCDLTEKKLPKFTDINFCINGSTPEEKTESFFSLQIQNYVKPAKTEIRSLQKTSDKKLELKWDPPPGKVPANCLEWQVELRQRGKNEKPSLTLTEDTSLTLSLSQDGQRHCVKVRSKLHRYCVGKSIWSDWSHHRCQSEKSLKQHTNRPERSLRHRDAVEENPK